MVVNQNYIVLTMAMRNHKTKKREPLARWCPEAVGEGSDGTQSRGVGGVVRRRGRRVETRGQQGQAGTALLKLCC